VTEEDWQDCTDPRTMLAFLMGKFSERKLRLFLCACARSLWHLLDDEEARTAVEVAERYADGLAGVAEREVAYQRASERFWARLDEVVPAPGVVSVQALFAQLRLGKTHVAVRAAGDADRLWQYYEGSLAQHEESLAPYRQGHFDREEEQDPCELLRDLCGPLPFRFVKVEPAWLSWGEGTVPRLAQAAYEERYLPSGELDSKRLAVLADALEEAGCGNEEILTHLRQQGTLHVRGCWVVDLILSKDR
jgi:hypothetical protein